MRKCDPNENPMDCQHLPPVRRRKHRDVVADKLKHWQSIEMEFRGVVDALGWPDFITSSRVNFGLKSAGIEGDPLLRRNFRKAMKSLGYALWPNPKSKDMKWSFRGKNVLIFRNAEAKLLAQPAAFELLAKLERT